MSLEKVLYTGQLYDCWPGLSFAPVTLRLVVPVDRELGQCNSVGACVAGDHASVTVHVPDFRQ